MDSWILHALLLAGLVIHGSNAGVLSDDDEDYNGDNSGDIFAFDGEGIENYNNMAGQVIHTSDATNTYGNYVKVSGDGETEHSGLSHVEATVTTTTSMTNLTSILEGPVIHRSNAGVISGDEDNSGDNSNDIGSPDTTSVTNLTTVLTTNLEATPPKHSHTPNLSPQGKSQTGWLLLALGIVLLFCMALLVSTITLACQVRNLRDQLSSVWPAHPARVNADVIRVRKVTEVMETEMEKMMEEAENKVEETLRMEADAQETEAAAVVPTAPLTDPSSDCVLNVSC
ncbi:uncharacterized protein LOC125721729 isoform X2 [Brienomyrus brachyistius]|nr:uncharacterized protein LOC125721729 isoform X2 [Brienomyrus brachyistius]